MLYCQEIFAPSLFLPNDWSILFIYLFFPSVIVNIIQGVVVELENFQRNSSKVSFLSSSSLRITESTASMASTVWCKFRDKTYWLHCWLILWFDQVVTIRLLPLSTELMNSLYSFSCFILSLFSFIEITFQYPNTCFEIVCGLMKIFLNDSQYIWLPHYLSKLLSSI